MNQYYDDFIKIPSFLSSSLEKNINIPATTAMETLNPNGRIIALQSGANVVMPNLSPLSVRKKYQLYDNKVCTGDESAHCRRCMENRINSIGCRIVTARGDSKNI